MTYPSHTTLITGVEPARHGIYDNRILDPENRSNTAWYCYARAIQVPTLPMAVRAPGLTAAAIMAGRGSLGIATLTRVARHSRASSASRSTPWVSQSP